MLAYIIIIGFIERLIPFEFAVPGVKLGLANAVVLTVIYALTFWDGLIIVLFKCILNAFLFGSASTFIYSACGSLLSFFVMFMLVKLLYGKISPVGVSLIGAVTHNMGQISAAAFIMGTVRIAYYIPALLVSGVITGVIVGFAVKYTLPVLNKAFTRQPRSTP